MPLYERLGYERADEDFGRLAQERGPSFPRGVGGLRYGQVAHIDKPVSKIVAGSDYLLGQPKELSFEAYDVFWEGGGRAFDSAQCYGDNSRVLGEWIASRGVTDEAIFFDKGCHPGALPRV